MRCDRQIQPANCLYSSVFKHILCVYVCMGHNRGVSQTPQTLMNDSCVCVCLLTKLKNTYTYFLNNAKYHPPTPQITDPVSHHTPSNKHTHTQYRHSFHIHFVIHCSLLLHLLNVLSTVMPWIISDQEHQHPFSESLPPTSGDLLNLQTRDHD